MAKKVVIAALIIISIIVNIAFDLFVPKYISILEECFNRKIVLDGKIYTIICLIIAFISVLIILDILLALKKRNSQNKGINFKTEDGTFGTANWMNKDEISNILSTDNSPGIILGKIDNKLVRLPFESFFNKNICVFGSSR